MKKELILDINETAFDGNAGFIITTTEQVIKLGIENWRVWGGEWGSFMSDDNIDSFIGSTLLDIEIVDELSQIDESFDIKDVYEGGVKFVNVLTSRGVLKFAPHNDTNGYYSHNSCIVIKQAKE